MLGELLEIDDRTLLVLGQELDFAADQPDVANALVHRVGDTLVVVDTGVTTAFRAALKAATRRVGDWSRAVVLTTHGHLDHIGNSDLADELGVPVEHYVPVRDLDQMRDPASSWVNSFSRVTGVVPLPAPPSSAGNKIVSMFQPLRPFAAATRTYEQLPLQRIRIGSARFTGWSFADGAVRVLRSQGHCAGHVIVHLSDSGVLHLRLRRTSTGSSTRQPHSRRPRSLSPTTGGRSGRATSSSATRTPSSRLASAGPTRTRYSPG
ncbi:MBL fold metallo-hydrolase [Pseudonocardia sp. Cha107L01]|uniref:MBL fold metallo-hydrolase n=1 Tax=Pseudonocardia sp. Cha107L01 TaxID=3457576 RepID=UPI00403ED758